MNNNQFQNLLRCKGVIDQLGEFFNKKFKSEFKGQYNLSLFEKTKYQIFKSLERIDKKTFIKYRDGLFTLSQVISQIYRIYDNIDYKVLEDFKEILKPSIYNSKISKETLRKMYDKQNQEEVKISDIINSQ